jgi:hypothetical protein
MQQESNYDTTLVKTKVQRLIFTVNHYNFIKMCVMYSQYMYNFKRCQRQCVTFMYVPTHLHDTYVPAG